MRPVALRPALTCTNVDPPSEVAYISPSPPDEKTISLLLAGLIAIAYTSGAPPRLKPSVARLVPSVYFWM